MTPEPERAESLFGEALGLEAGQRGAFLDRACAAAPVVRAAVERLLNDLERAEAAGFLGTPAQAPPPTLAGAADRVAEPPRVAGYEILGELGRGGMGVVYRARQLKANRLVALKMLLARSHSSVPERVRFQIEAEAVAGLQHPNIVSLYEAGEHDGLPFFSLELCDGGSLARKLETWRPTPAEAAGLVETLARAIHYAHLRGVIHRDLKPANVLLQGRAAGGREEAPEDSAFGVAKISDFGLAKRLDDSVGVSHSGAVLGTPAYMAPEQAAGKVRATGPATDVYALGAILYECLTGRPPFQGETPAEAVRQVQSEEPAPPSRFRPRLPRDLETICLKCLQKEPAQRYPTGEELAEDLRRFRAGEPVRARPVGRAERLWRWSKRKPALAAAVGLAAGALAGAVAVSIAFAVYQMDATQRLARGNDDLQKANQRAKDALTQLRKNYDQLQATDQRRQQALRESAHLALGYGLSLCEQGEVDPGMLWLGRGLESAVGAEAADLERDIRTSLAHWGRPPTLLQGLSEHTGEVRGAAFSPDGETILTSSWDGTAVLWKKAETGKPFEYFRTLRHGDRITTAAFSPDGKTVLTGGFDRTARLWDVVEGESRLKLSHDGAVTAAAFSPDSRTVLTASAAGEVLLWEVSTGKRLWEVHVVLPVCATAFSPDGRAILTGSGNLAGLGGNVNGRARLWEAATGKPLRGEPMSHDGRSVWCVAFSPDGRTILMGGDGYESQLSVRTVSTAAPPTFLSGHIDAVLSAAFSPDGRTILTGSRDKTARLWNVRTGKPLGKPLQHDGEVNSVAFSPDGKTILTVSKEKKKGLLWQVPPPVEGDVKQVTLWIQAVTHKEFDASGAIRKLDDQAVRERRQRLKELGGPPLP